MPRGIPPSAKGLGGELPARRGCQERGCSPLQSSPARDWEILGYHGTLWSSIKASARGCHPLRRQHSLSLTVDKLKEWLPRARCSLAKRFHHGNTSAVPAFPWQDAGRLSATVTPFAKSAPQEAHMLKTIMAAAA